MKSNRGTFIVFEGLDRSGKSTQVKLLESYFHTELNLNAQIMRFPDRTTMLGQIISEYLQGNKDINDQTIHLLFQANRWEQCNQIKQLLNQGISIICDRYAYSGVAFSSAKGLDLQWCKNGDSKLPQPDIIFYLDAPIEILSKRGEYGNERYERIEFQEKVRQQFEKLIESEYMIRINVNMNIQEIHKQIVKYVNKGLIKGNEKVRKLWNDGEIDKENRKQNV